MQLNESVQPAVGWTKLSLERTAKPDGGFRERDERREQAHEAREDQKRRPP